MVKTSSKLWPKKKNETAYEKKVRLFMCKLPLCDQVKAPHSMMYEHDWGNYHPSKSHKSYCNYPRDPCDCGLCSGA